MSFKYDFEPRNLLGESVLGVEFELESIRPPREQMLTHLMTSFFRFIIFVVM